MAKVLGLDLGTNSIGWAVVDTDINKIEDCGVRIFPEGVEPTTIGKGDGEQSKNAARRDARQKRRQYYRVKLRKVKLLKILIELEMCPLSILDLNKWSNWDKKKGKIAKQFPSTKEFTEWLKLNPYELRSRALIENITLYELGRIFYHFIQHRGFLSSRKGKDEGKIFSGKENMTGINETQEKVKNTTLGNYLYSIYPEPKQPFKIIKDEKGKEQRIRARYTLRDMYIKEFNEIWKKQEEHLNLKDRTIEKVKTIFLHGSIENKRNKSKIEYLEKNNIQFDLSQLKSNKGKTINKLVTKIPVSLKEFLAGNIQEDEAGVRYKSSESILFWQRPLRSQKGLLEECRFEQTIKNKEGKYIQKGKTPCPLSHPAYEEFRAYQVINNISYGLHNSKTRANLDESQRLLVLELINSKADNFNFKEIPKKLKLTYEQFNYADEQKVAGNRTIKLLKSIFPDEILNKKYEITVNNEKKIEYGYERIWHNLQFYEDNHKLIEKLNKDYGLSEKEADKIKTTRLKEGYSNISLKAIRNILPFLKQGYKYSIAVVLAGVKNTFGNRWEYFEQSHHEIIAAIVKIIAEKDNKEGEAIQKIKNYLSNPENQLGFSDNDPKFIKLYHHSQEIEKIELKDKIPPVENLRNPIVQQGVNELSRLVNQLKNKYGKFNQIKVELGRDLKNNKTKRQEIGYRIAENEKKNDKAREVLTEYGLAHSRDNIQKVLLYNEIKEKNGVGICPYTGKTIKIDDILGRNNNIQIEHIIPKSISLDDSMANKTICEANFNREKGEKTPYQFYKINPDKKLWGAESWDDIEHRAYKLLPYPKAKRFCSKTEFKKDDFIERQLNDTRYISKKTKEILSHICDDVRVLPGSLTSELRHLWGLNSILQPINKIDIPGVVVEGEKRIHHYVVKDENNIPLYAKRKYNSKPELTQNEITYPGIIDKNIFQSNGSYFKIKAEAPDLENGKYWAILKLSDPKRIIQIYKDKPGNNEDEVILRGRIEKNKFKNDRLNPVTVKDKNNGYYWAKFTIKDKNFEYPQKDNKPKRNGKQLVLFGNVENGIYTSFIYKCKTNLDDGKYWLILDLDFENAEYFETRNEYPEIANEEIIIDGTIDENGVFTSDIDYQYSLKTNEKAGKYWVVLQLTSKINQFALMENQLPKTDKGQQITEGNIWVDKHIDVGEIKFDPKKNRDDHRHHAIDAIAIALSEQSYFQKLSTQNANRQERRRGREFDNEQLNFPEPWEGFRKDAEKAAQSILISHKQNRNVLTEIKKRITKNGKTYTSSGKSVRGQLHKESVYGKRKAPGEKEHFYHIRKSVNELSESQLNKIVDDKIREIVIRAKREEKELDKKIKALEKQIPKTQTENDEQQIKIGINDLKEQIKKLYTLPNKRGEDIPIKKVRIKENIGNAEKLKENINQYVNPRNNHHVLIYKDAEGNLKENIVSFWEVVERKKQKMPVFQLPGDGKEIVETLQINDMFLLGLSNEQYNANINNKAFLSEHLFRVQKISSMYYTFRYHLASTLDNIKEEKSIRSLGAWKNVNPIKVTINNLSNIKLN